MIPDFLVIGHAARDLLDSGSRVGGTVTYAALTAQRLGKLAAVVAGCGPDIDLKESLPGIEVVIYPSPKTTTFRNLYSPQGRTQFIESIADPIPLLAIPDEWHESHIVLLGPIVHEIDEGIIDLFPASFIALTPQGWLRRWDKWGQVSPQNWLRAAATIPRVGVTIVSEQDLKGEALSILPVLERAPLAIITREEKGASLFAHNKRWDLPARPAQVVDPTGAGDVFAAAFVIKYDESGDPVLSTQFAQAAASFSVEAQGTEGIPHRQNVEEWLKSHGLDLGPC